MKEFYFPLTPMLTREDFPTEMQAIARRQNFAGVGTTASPHIMGWIVPARAPGGGVAYDANAKSWLKERGFQFGGGKWYLRDDVADERNLLQRSAATSDDNDAVETRPRP